MATTRDTLLVAPTGGGETLAGFLPTLAQLRMPHAGLHTLYVSALKALTNDIARTSRGRSRHSASKSASRTAQATPVPASVRVSGSIHPIFC